MKKAIVGLILILLAGAILFMHCVGTPEITSAKMAIDQKDYDKAVEQCKLAVEKNPQNAMAYFVMGQAYGHKKMYREMNDAFKKSLEFSEKNAADIEQHRLKYWADIFNEGVNNIRQNKLDVAIDRFQMAVELIPDNIDAYKNLAYAYTQNDQDDLAIETYKKALAQHPENVQVKGYLGALYYQTEQYGKAIEVLSEVIAEADPKSREYDDALYHMAYSYDLMGQSDKAIETYRTALEVNPTNKDLLFNMGRLYFMQKKHGKAIETFEKVLALDPEDFETNLSLGNTYINIADSLTNEAKEVDAKGNLVLPDNEITKRLETANTNFDRAIDYLEKAAEIKPDNANVWTLLGIAYVRTGDAEKGQEAFDKAEKLQGNTQ